MRRCILPPHLVAVLLWSGSFDSFFSFPFPASPVSPCADGSPYFRGILDLVRNPFPEMSIERRSFISSFRSGREHRAFPTTLSRMIFALLQLPLLFGAESPSLRRESHCRKVNLPAPFRAPFLPVLTSLFSFPPRPPLVRKNPLVGLSRKGQKTGASWQVSVHPFAPPVRRVLCPLPVMFFTPPPPSPCELGP